MGFTCNLVGWSFLLTPYCTRAHTCTCTHTSNLRASQAALEGHNDIVKLLVTKGANVNAASVGGNTALMKCAQNGHDDVLNTLIEAGADLRQKNDDGEWPSVTLRAVRPPARMLDMRARAHGRAHCARACAHALVS